MHLVAQREAKDGVSPAKIDLHQHDSSLHENSPDSSQMGSDQGMASLSDEHGPELTKSSVDKDTEKEKQSRTVFLANVSIKAITSKTARKQLLKHLSSFLPSLKSSSSVVPHKLVSLRFRSVAFSSNKLSKRAAFAQQALMESTTQCTNAYAVYSSPIASQEAVKRLNGSMILGRHLRVDSVSKPSKVVHKKCVFVGNLGFVNNDSSTVSTAAISKPSADVEEGLWHHFGAVGPVQSVRVIRDSLTRVGKGFAYVQFEVRCSHFSLHDRVNT